MFPTNREVSQASYVVTVGSNISISFSITDTATFHADGMVLSHDMIKLASGCSSRRSMAQVELPASGLWGQAASG